MTLDLRKISNHMHRLTDWVVRHQDSRRRVLARAIENARRMEVSVVEARRLEGHATWLVAGLDSELLTRIQAPPPVSSYSAIAVDGSQIDIDRHSPVRCYVINIGRACFQYGEYPSAMLDSNPEIYLGDDLTFQEPGAVRDFSVTPQLVGLLRSVEELEALAELVDGLPKGLPVVGLLDGTLIFWSLAGQIFPDFVRDEILTNRLIPVLDRFKRIVVERDVALISYVSAPRSTDVVNAIRISPAVCRFDRVNCDVNCGGVLRAQRNCEEVGGITDADFFGDILGVGDRSGIFRTTSSVVTDYYGEHQIHFCYVNVGEEIARLEMPQWVAEDERLVELAHSVVLSQAQKGYGYPLVLQEAHEQAVITMGDRMLFDQLLERSLLEDRLPINISQKSRSKRTRFI
jgi:hypothetical protein